MMFRHRHILPYRSSTIGSQFVHGGKGTFQNYNADQKAAIKALPETADKNDYYLFYVDDAERLDTAGNKARDIIAGYMPVGRHYGFLYGKPNPNYIAHELGHGTDALHHTFSEDSESFYTTAKTNNLMDYEGGARLNHRQWQWAHENHRNVLGFLDEEGESEAKTEEGDDIIKRVKEFCLNLKYEDGSESVFDDDLIDNYLSVNGDKYKYRRYIREIRIPISFLTKENITFTQSDKSSGYSYADEHISIASKAISLSDVIISLFHEYLHRVNDVTGIYRYNNSMRHTQIKHFSRIVTIPQKNFDAYLTENTEVATHLYMSFLAAIMTDKRVDINMYIPYYNISKLPDELYYKLKEYCIENKLLDVEIRTDESAYEPTNYIRDELSVYHWCLEYEKLLGGFSDSKRRIYSEWIKKYKHLFVEYKQYEIEHNLNEEGNEN